MKNKTAVAAVQNVESETKPGSIRISLDVRMTNRGRIEVLAETPRGKIVRLSLNGSEAEFGNVLDRSLSFLALAKRLKQAGQPSPLDDIAA